MSNDKKRQHKRYKTNSSDHYYPLNKNLTEILEKQKNSLYNKKILDIGAGENPWEDFYKDLDVTLADINQNSTVTIDVILTINEPLPFEDNSYDIIFLWDVLEHIEFPDSFVRELYRVLKESGRVVGNVPFLYRFHEEPHDYYRYTPSGLETLFCKGGAFKEIITINIGSHYFVAQKALEERGRECTKLPFFEKLLLKFLVKFLKFISLRNVKSYNSAFSYYFEVFK